MEKSVGVVGVRDARPRPSLFGEGVSEEEEAQAVSVSLTGEEGGKGTVAP